MPRSKQVPAAAFKSKSEYVTFGSGSNSSNGSNGDNASNAGNYVGRFMPELNLGHDLAETSKQPADPKQGNGEKVAGPETLGVSAAEGEEQPHRFRPYSPIFKPGGHGQLAPRGASYVQPATHTHNEQSDYSTGPTGTATWGSGPESQRPEPYIRDWQKYLWHTDTEGDPKVRRRQRRKQEREEKQRQKQEQEQEQEQSED